MCSSWLSDIIMLLLSAEIGGLVTWLGVKTILKNENQAIKEERIENPKPILINHTCTFDANRKSKIEIGNMQILNKNK